MLQLISILLFLIIPDDSPEVIELKNDKNFELEGYYVRDSYLLNDTERIVIASKITRETTEFEGLKLLYLIDNEIEFISQDAGESYIYKPTFYKFKDSTTIIACEQGFEYSIGIDLFELKSQKLKKLGYMDIASDTLDMAESIVPHMKIERKYGDQYHFKFSGNLFINPGGKAETKISGDLVKAIYTPETDKISLMIRKN
ncbi:hypothetical protein [Fulvivirga lutea]|uniref:Uncharacterized protein n=1 Tax=Fulvivirga lutea TaxID=2810512 RepID=A0A974WF04_9BACT|nr:hypothetical protein [Fulvivirga lutea]QSE97213.1 hypothetical protein JR347_16725 [Fulvivirga lutea]